MPTYTLTNTENGDTYNTFCSWNELETFLEEHPAFKKVMSAPAIIGGIEGKTHRVDDGFKENMQRISAAHPGSALADRYGGGTTKEQKTRAVLKKHGAI